MTSKTIKSTNSMNLSMENHPPMQGGHFGFSAASLDDLAQLATEFTLATVIVDDSGSTAGFSRNMEKVLKTVQEACYRNPRADNTLLRVIKFNVSSKEVHGYQPITVVGPGSYDGILKANGSTALFDATIDGLEATDRFAKDLGEERNTVNAIVVVITDGENNAGKFPAPTDVHHVKTAVQKCRQHEHLESMTTILIRVNITNPASKQALDHFAKEAGFDQCEDLGNATPDSLAKLANFISQSVSSTSAALGTGQKSSPVKF